jgi:hypothetical protein
LSVVWKERKPNQVSTGLLSYIESQAPESASDPVTLCMGRQNPAQIWFLLSLWFINLLIWNFNTGTLIQVRAMTADVVTE